MIAVDEETGSPPVGRIDAHRAIPLIRPNHDLSWHIVDDEFIKFAIEHLRETGLIPFGRRTYQPMKNFWPKPAPCCFRNGFVQEGIVRSD